MQDTQFINEPGADVETDVPLDRVTNLQGQTDMLSQREMEYGQNPCYCGRGICARPCEQNLPDSAERCWCRFCRRDREKLNRNCRGLMMLFLRNGGNPPQGDVWQLCKCHSCNFGRWFLRNCEGGRAREYRSQGEADAKQALQTAIENVSLDLLGQFKETVEQTLTVDNDVSEFARRITTAEDDAAELVLDIALTRLRRFKSLPVDFCSIEHESFALLPQEGSSANMAGSSVMLAAGLAAVLSEQRKVYFLERWLRQYYRSVNTGAGSDLTVRNTLLLVMPLLAAIHTRNITRDVCSSLNQLMSGNFGQNSTSHELELEVRRTADREIDRRRLEDGIVSHSLTLLTDLVNFIKEQLRGAAR